MKKKKEVKNKFVKIEQIYDCYETIKIPEGATHFEAKLDYSGCYYESDYPTIKVTFYKEENDE